MYNNNFAMKGRLTKCQQIMPQLFIGSAAGCRRGLWHIGESHLSRRKAPAAREPQIFLIKTNYIRNCKQ